MDKITTTADTLAVVREAMEGEWFSEEVDAALALIEQRLEELERKERVNSGLTRNLSVVQAELEKAEAERDEARQYLQRAEKQTTAAEQRVVELEAALEGMESMRERERDELEEPKPAKPPVNPSYVVTGRRRRNLAARVAATARRALQSKERNG